jgi:hypothetical protein
MSTTSLQLTTSYQLVSTGPCLVTPAVSNIGNEGVQMDSDIYDNVIFVNIGTSLPSNTTFNYHEFTGIFQYSGSQKIYMRTSTGTQYVKITAIV